MGYKDENILGLIENRLRFLDTLLFPQSTKGYENIEHCVDLKKQLEDLLKKNQFKDACDKLFLNIENSFDEKVRRYDLDILRLGYLFFLKLNEIDQNILEKNGFSKHDLLLESAKLERYVLGMK